jgi:hypothetical protein
VYWIRYRHRDRDKSSGSNRINSNHKEYRRDIQTTMNVISNISKVIRTLGIMGIMLALAGFAVSSAPSASASSVRPVASKGNVAVYAIFPPTVKDTSYAQVVIWDQNGDVVGKGIVTSRNSYVVSLAPGIYKVSVTADGYKAYGELIEVVRSQTTTIKAPLYSEQPPATIKL